MFCLHCGSLCKAIVMYPCCLRFCSLEKPFKWFLCPSLSRSVADADRRALLVANTLSSIRSLAMGNMLTVLSLPYKFAYHVYAE